MVRLLEPTTSAFGLTPIRDAEHLWQDGSIEYGNANLRFAITMASSDRQRLIRGAAERGQTLREHLYDTDLGRHCHFIGVGMSQVEYDAILGTIPLLVRDDLEGGADKELGFLSPSLVSACFNSGTAEPVVNLNARSWGAIEVQVLGVPGGWAGFCVADPQHNSVAGYGLTVPRPQIVDGLPTPTVAGELTGIRSHAIWKQRQRFWHLTSGADLGLTLQWVARLQSALAESSGGEDG